MGRAVRICLPHTHRRWARRAPLGAPRREPLGARLRDSSARHAPVPGGCRAGARSLELRRRDNRRGGSNVRRGRVAVRDRHPRPRPRGELRIRGAHRGARPVVRRLALQSAAADSGRARHRRDDLRLVVCRLGSVGR